MIKKKKQDLNFLNKSILKNTRKTGIDIICDVPWDTHLCQLYQTKEELIDILVAYFKAGQINELSIKLGHTEPYHIDSEEE